MPTVSIANPANIRATLIAGHIECIKRVIDSMIEQESRYRSLREDGNFWSEDNASVKQVWDLWNILRSQPPNWIAQNFRFLLGELLSGITTDIYEKMQKCSAEELESCKFVKDYRRACEGLSDCLVVSERQFHPSRRYGVYVGGKWLSSDISRVQRYLANLNRCGALSHLEEASEDPVILEIGGGYGMLASKLLGLTYGNSEKLQRMKYILVDFPKMIGFSACFLAMNFPEMRFGFFDPSEPGGFDLEKKLNEADVLWIPNYALEVLEDLPKAHLVLNTMSFQEMAEKELHRYAEFISRKLDGYLYSDNMRRHPYNYGLMHRVRDILSDYFLLLPRQEEGYNQVEWTRTFMFETYVHVGTSRRRPKLFDFSECGDVWLFSESHRVNLNNGEVEIYGE